jgi:hypothetical protein
MNISFIICTADPNQNSVETCINSITDLKIPNYEILVIGGEKNDNGIIFTENISFISFDESTRKAWATRKKNIAAKTARYTNLCIMHDYFSFDSNWYTGWANIHEYWDVGCNPIESVNGERLYSDWVTWDDPVLGKHFPLSYSESSKTKNQYINGAYFLVKKNFFLANPMNE